MSGSNNQIGDQIRDEDDGALRDAENLLRSGQLVAVPTETVYGLAADATNADAVAEIYRAKGRPDFNPLIVHVPDMDAASELGQFNTLAKKLAKSCWPGPLTLVVPKTSDCPVAAAVTAGLDTIAIRSPNHPLMRKILEQSGLFLAAPSANKSGAISPTTAGHVKTGLGDAAPLILDGGACQQGLESTIVAIRDDNYQILRHGPISSEDIEEIACRPGIVVQTSAIEAPGQLSSHYAPKKPLRLEAKKVAEGEFHIGFGTISGDVNLSQAADLAEAASNLFAFLHIADASDCGAIAVAPIPLRGMGEAINDRLSRAAAAR